jgi:hypothetical protein
MTNVGGVSHVEPGDLWKTCVLNIEASALLVDVSYFVVGYPDVSISSGLHQLSHCRNMGASGLWGEGQ